MPPGVDVSHPRHLARRVGSSPCSPTSSRPSSACPTTSPSSASCRCCPRPTSSSCPTSRRRCRSSTPPSPSCRRKGYALPDYPDDAGHRRRTRHQGRYDRVKGSRRQPGASRRQLRPPRPEGRQGVRPQAPALDGRVVGRLEDPRRHDGRRTTSARTSSRSRSTPPTTCASSSSHGDGTVTVLKASVPRAGGRGRRRHVHVASAP